MSGIDCYDVDLESCLVGAGDGMVTAEEVAEYAAMHADRFQKELEEVFQRPLPWALDDLRPETQFDADLRQRIDSFIALVDNQLTVQGFEKGTDAYDERMAASLFCFQLYPSANVGLQHQDFYREITAELESLGLTRIRVYLEEQGGLSSRRGKCRLEPLSALESLASGRGCCMEKTKVLYALFRRAGIEAAVLEIIFREEDVERVVPSFITRNPFLLEGLKGMFQVVEPTYYNHWAVGVRFGGRTRIFDPSIAHMDARHDRYRVVSPRRALAQDFFQKAMVAGSSEGGDVVRRFANMGNAIAPNEPMGIHISGMVEMLDGQYQSALTFFERVLSVAPTFSMAWEQMGVCYIAMDDYESAVEVYTEMLQRNPRMWKRVFAPLRQALVAASKKRWQSTLAEALLSEELNLQPHGMEATFRLAALLWQAGEKMEAQDFVRAVVVLLKDHQVPLSKHAQRFLDDMIQILPQEMRCDLQIRGSLLIINELRQLDARRSIRTPGTFLDTERIDPEAK